MGYKLTQSANNNSYVGLSTDTMPTINADTPIGAILYEVNLTTGVTDKYLNDGAAWRLQYDARQLIDMTVDSEIEGTEVEQDEYNHTSGAGETVTVLAVGATNLLKLSKAFLSVSADITGLFQLKVGARSVGGLYNPKSGGQYAFISVFPDYVLGAAGEDLTLVVPAAASFSVNYSYKLGDV
ncbi:MAG: hypothetical protein ABIH23_04675 [bacterium]